MEKMKAVFLLIAVVSINLVYGSMDPWTHKNWNLVNEDVCGQQPALSSDGLFTRTDPETRDAQHGEYPWVVLIHLQSPVTADEDKKCMGTIISRRYILTASSCFQIYGSELVPESVLVRAGKLDSMDIDGCDFNTCASKPDSYQATRIILYNSNSPVLDGQNIALIEVTDIVFNDHVAPICIEHGELLETDYGGEVAIKVTGWGPNPHNGKRDTKLQHASATILKQDVNELIYDLMPDSFRAHESLESFFGVQVTDSEVSHDYDIGGPLMVKKIVGESKPRFYLYGILSFKPSISLPDHGTPDIYTKVRHYMQWVLDNMNG